MGNDGAPDSGTCAFDPAIACCCRGDVGATLVCNADATLSRTPSGSGFSVYYGDDCTRPCGPCTVACPYAGNKPQDAQAGDAAGDWSPTASTVPSDARKASVGIANAPLLLRMPCRFTRVTTKSTRA